MVHFTLRMRSVSYETRKGFSGTPEKSQASRKNLYVKSYVRNRRVKNPPLLLRCKTLELCLISISKILEKRMIIKNLMTFIILSQMFDLPPTKIKCFVYERQRLL